MAAEQGDWYIATALSETSGEAAVIRIRMSRPAGIDPWAFATAITITWRYDSDDQFPTAEVNEKQLAYEAAIDELSGENGFAELVQVSTGMGLKEWLYYSSDRERFMAALNSLLAEHDPYPLEIQFYEDPRWELWQRTVDAACRGPDS